MKLYCSSSEQQGHHPQVVPTFLTEQLQSENGVTDRFYTDANANASMSKSRFVLLFSEQKIVIKYFSVVTVSTNSELSLLNV